MKLLTKQIVILGCLSTSVAPAATRWTRALPGAVSSYAVSKDGSALVVATQPDPDIAGSSTRYLLSRLDRNGKILWSQVQRSPIREVDLSEDGTLTAVATYDHELKALDTRGKVLWSVPRTCRPTVIQASRQVLCYHDDDADSNVAFDLWDRKGKMVQSYSIAGDVLALKLSVDQKQLALGLTGGRVHFLSGPDFKQKNWEAKVAGEVIDVAATSEPTPGVAVLFQGKEKGSLQKIAIFNSQGKSLGEFQTQAHSIQVEFATDGRRIFYYGNGNGGQFVASAGSQLESIHFASEVAAPSQGFGADSWIRGVPLPTFFNQAISVFVRGSGRGKDAARKDRIGGVVALGLEQVVEGVRKNQVVIYDSSGNWVDRIDVPSGQDAYLYRFRPLASGSGIVVASDDGRLSVMVW